MTNTTYHLAVTETNYPNDAVITAVNNDGTFFSEYKLDRKWYRSGSWREMRYPLGVGKFEQVDAVFAIIDDDVLISRTERD